MLIKAILHEFLHYLHFVWHTGGPELKEGSLSDSCMKGDGAETVDGNSTEE